MSQDTPGDTPESKNELAQVDDAVVHQLAEIAESMSSMVGRMLDSQAVQTKDIDYFREELRIVRDAIRRIAKVLHEGNGERPLISRVAVLENQIVNLTEDINTLQQHEERRLEEERELKQIERRGRNVVVGAIVSGVFALATSIISLFT